MQTETIVDDPRRPLRGTSHLDSRAGLTGFYLSLFPLPFPPCVRFVPLPYPSSCVSRWKKRRVLLTYHRDRGHGGFPEIIRKSSPILPTCARPFSELHYHRVLTCNVRAFTRDRIHLYAFLRELEGFTIGASSLPGRLLL